MYSGPHIIKDGLVFGYDTGYGIADNTTATRFYPGMPTTNLNADPYHSTRSAGDTISLSAWGGDTGQGSFEVNTSPAGGGMMFINHNTSNPAGSGGTFTDFPSTRYTLTNGVTYTRSWWAKADDNRSVSAHICSCNRDSTNTYIVGPSITLTPTWQRYSSTFNYTGPTSSDWQFRHIIYDASKVYIANVQLEVGSIASPPLIGTRSDTASLIDLKKTTGIDVGDVSFDSNAQITFDGTNDYINMGDLAIIKLGINFTIEAVVKPEQDKWMYFFHKGYGQNNSLAWGRHSTNDKWFFATMINGSYQYSYMGTATLNQYCHLVASYDGANLRLYENGDLQATVATTHDMMTSTQPLGIGGPDRYWNGEIPITKVYSKALSATEVEQNFKAYKNRFDI